MATESTLGKVHIFPSEESYNTNKGSVGTNDLALVPMGTATTSEYGLTKLADDADLLLESKDKPMTVDNAYKLNDFRRMNKAYKVGDKVACAFEYEFYLECIQAGTTSTSSLNTQNVTFGQVIEDGTVKWKVKTNARTVNGVEADKNGNIDLSGKFVTRDTGQTITGYKTFSGDVNLNGNVKMLNGKYNYADDRLVFIHPNVVKGTVPDTTASFKIGMVENEGQWAYKDVVGILEFYYYTNKDVLARLCAVNANESDSDGIASISVINKADGTTYASAPTPANTAIGNEIITAKWIRDNIRAVALDTFFPVGSIYMSVLADTAFNPNTAFGGTWEKIENRFLYGAGSKAIGSTGGAENVTLTEAQMPSHAHSVGSINATGFFPTLHDGNQLKTGGVFMVTAKQGSGAWGLDAYSLNQTAMDFNMSRNRSGSTASTGSTQAHNNMPPYLVITIWKRTA